MIELHEVESVYALLDFFSALADSEREDLGDLLGAALEAESEYVALDLPIYRKYGELCLWTVEDEDGEEIVYEHMTSREAISAHAANLEERKETQWIGVYFWPSYQLGDQIEDDKDNRNHEVITIDPLEPPCRSCPGSDEHDWQSPHELVGGCESNPGVWGNGGGVIMKEVCVLCGCGKTTDTWAQSDDGVQGLTRIEYEENEYEIDALSR